MRGETRASLRRGGAARVQWLESRGCGTPTGVRLADSSGTMKLLLRLASLSSYQSPFNTSGKAHGQGQMEALHHLSARGRPLPNFICRTHKWKYGGMSNEITDIM